MAVLEREIRGLPLWLLQSYLEELGGTAGANGLIQGEGWSAQLTQLEDYQIGSLRVGQVKLVIEGSEAALQRLRAPLEQKLLRAGG